jgi:hypothetical protein
MTNSIAIRKAVVFTLIAALLAWTGAAYVASLAQPARAAAAGDLIKMDGNPAVYYLGSDLKRYVFPNQKTYNTWYADFSSVVVVAQSELESYAIGGNATYRAGTRLGKITTDPKVYAVEPGGVLRWVTSEAIAMDLYGSNWNTKIDDIPDPFFVNYSVGSDVSTSVYPSGALVKASGSSDVYYIDGSNKRMVQDASAMSANRFQDKFVQETSLDLNTYTTSSVIGGAETDLITVAGPEVGTPSTSSVGTLSVSLASDTPAAGTVVENAARVGFTKVNFTASGGDVVIDSLGVTRTGLSADSNFADLILLDVSNGTSVADAVQVGNEKSLGSTHTATFNDDITVSNGTTKSILIAANMGGTMQAGEIASLELTAVNLNGSATVSGSLPLVGNGMTMNGTLAIGTLTIANGGANPGASTQNVGTTDYIVSSLKITAGSQEPMALHSIRFYQNGTAADSDLANLELVVDGAVVASVANPKDKYATFKFASPIVIAKGNNKDFDLRADIVSGSARTISMDIDKKADVVAKGQTFGFFRVPSYDNSTSPFFNANDTTIDKGSIAFSKGVLGSLNVSEGASGVTLGAFKATVQGEPVQVTQFVIAATVSGTGNTGDVTNLAVVDANGLIVAGPVDPDTTVAARDTATSTDTIVFPVGTNTYTIRGDLNSDFAANDTIQIDLPGPSTLTTAKGDTTNQTITANPVSDLSLDTVTVKAATLSVSVSSTPAAQSVIIGSSGFTFTNLIFDAADSGEDIRVTQVVLAHRTDADTSREDHIANLTLWDGSTQLFPIKQPTQTASATSASTTFSLTNPIIVPKGGSKTIAVKGDVVGGAADDTHQFGCNGAACIVATGASTGNSVTESTTNGDGSVMTLATAGSLTVATAASNPNADLLVGGASKATIGVLLLTASNEDLDLTDIHFTATQVNSGAFNDEFSKFYLYDGATEVAAVTPTTTTALTFQGIGSGKFRIPKGSSGKTLTVKADTAAITDQQGDGNTGDSSQGMNLAVAQDAYQAVGVGSGTKLAATSMSGTFTGKEFTVYKSLPSFSKQTLASNTLINSSGVPLFKFKLTADAKGDVGFYKAAFAITTTTATVTAFELFEEPGTSSEVNLTDNAVREVGTVLTVSSDGKNGQYSIDILFDTGTDGVGSGGEFRFIPAGQSKNFELRGSVANSVAGSSVSTVLRGDGAFAGTSPDQASDVDGDEQDDFIWSDLHYGNSSSTATATDEWFNGYRIPGLSSTTTAENLNR